MSKQGCPALRRYLYLAAGVAIRFDPAIAAWYHRLCDRGKAPKCALCAVAHKILRQLMGKIREQRKEAHADPLPLAA